MDSDLEQTARSLMQDFVAAGRPAAEWIDRLPTDEANCRALAVAFDRIGVEAYNSDDIDVANDAFWHLFVLRLTLVRENPDSRDDLRDFASAEDLLGQAQLWRGDLVSAERLLREASAYRQGLHSDDETDVHAAYLHGIGLWHLSWVEARKRNFDVEKSLVERARDQLAPLKEQYPGSAYIESACAEVEARLSEIQSSQ
ncbi:protein of unknown function [Hyphomicrobium sp. 1Nfss2.1]|uniref:hypothetical protein n=1 Tax=Hyphomicrobium sp. 1Nfss2.1 TaxID=3413936 RepID=UPI003C79D373